MAMTSPLVLESSTLKMHSHAWKTFGCLNLVTHPRDGVLPSVCFLKTVDSRAQPRQFARFGRNLGFHVSPLRKVYGTRKTQSMMAGGIQYDGVIPLHPSTKDERHPGNVHSPTPVLEEVLDSSSLLEVPSSATAPAFLEESTSGWNMNHIEQRIEQTIFNFRFLTLFGVVGSLLGAVLCFLKGCLFVSTSYKEYFRACLAGIHSGRVILYLVEAVDVYLMGTVMLIFGMGLYELFVSSLEVPSGFCPPKGASTTPVCNSNLFGLFQLRERPKWLEIRSLDELKTKLGHVIVMILLVGMFEKSKKVIVHTSADFLCFSASILLSSGSLYLLSMLHGKTPVG